MADRNFDDLAPRFARNIYGSHKGRVRLEVLKRDLCDYVPLFQNLAGVEVLDMGAGQGHFSLGLAEQGAHVHLCDVSEKMLAMAKERWQEICEAQAQAGMPTIGSATFTQCALQQLPAKGYPLVLGHAVLEWLEDPRQGFGYLVDSVATGGYLSVIVYNAHGLAFKNLLRGNFKKFDRNNFKAFKGSLTPISPLTPEQLMQWGNELKLELVGFSGIRVFQDYILDKSIREADPDGLLVKELEYSRLEPFRNMARYLHFVFKRP